MKNFSKGRLSGSHVSTDTALTLVSGEAARFDQGDIVVIYDAVAYDNAVDAYHSGDAELVYLVDAPTANTFPTVTRGYEGTTAIDFPNTTTWNVENAITAGMVADFSTKNILRAVDGGTLNVSAGAIAVTHSSHRVNTGSAAQVVDTISGGVEGMVLFLRSSSSSYSLTLEDGTGNIQVRGGSDKVLTSTHDEVILRYYSTSGIWLCGA